MARLLQKEFNSTPVPIRSHYVSYKYRSFNYNMQIFQIESNNNTDYCTREYKHLKSEGHAAVTGNILS